jgi:dienelactone hydrolase
VLTRRQLLSIAAASAARPALGQTFPGVAYRPYRRCLPDYLRDLAQRAYVARNAEIAKLTTPEAVRKRQAWARATFWKLTGGMPDRTPLNARTVGSFTRDAYRVEKVVYESTPEFFIPANLYIPTNAKPPFPGVLFQMGHTLNGKAADSYQRCCQGLARLGFLVLAFDPMGQGERVNYPDTELKRTRLASSDAEHTTPGKQLLLYGDTVTRMQAWDAVRSLDYLAAHPLVDPKRLASTGQSGGGTQTMHLLAVDDRLATAVICSGNTENVACANFDPPGSTDDAEQDFVYSAPAGFDRWDTIYPFAPKPLLISVSDMDSFHTYSPSYIENGWEEFLKLRKVYGVLGKAENLAWADTPLPHGLSYDSRLQVYNWMRRYLQGQVQPIDEEPPTAPEPDSTLWVSEGGNVIKAFGGQTPHRRNRARKVQQAPMPLDKLLRLDPLPAPPRLAVLRRVPSKDVSIEVVEAQSAPKVWLPGWLFRPRKADTSKPVVIALDQAGLNARWREGELYQNLAMQGYTVCVPDLRGFGTLQPEYGRAAANRARSHEDEENYAWGSLILGKPLVGQRVTDILALVGGLARHPALTGKRIAVAAAGRLTVPALFAAALEPAITQLYLAGGLASYRSIVETEEYSTSFGSFVPDILLHTDLPEVAASMAPRKVRLGGTVDAAGERMDVAKVQALYVSANIEVRAQAQWDLASLSL